MVPGRSHMAGEEIGFWSTELRDRIPAIANGKQRAKLQVGSGYKPSKSDPSVTYFLQQGPQTALPAADQVHF